MITLGLRAGYGPAGRTYDLEEAVRTAHRWMTERAARGEPLLSGMFTPGEVVFADPEDRAASHRERVAIFTSEVLPQYAGDLDGRTVRELLDELAGEMGRALEQEEIHIAYGDRIWTLTAKLQLDR
ncbi:MAG: hypothetical protein JOZ11_15775 [Alphaproteobacteria bacterium]|nr:hypothetical protein [Alphaproteobacteria bacterium]